MPSTLEQTIIFNKKNFKTIQEFLDWFFTNKKELENKNLNFVSENDINVKEIEDMYGFIKFYIKTKKTCDKAINDYNNKLCNDNEDIEFALKELVRMNNDGKLLRGVLVALGYYNNKSDENYKTLALSLELFQTSILIHDDIIDNANIRRGKDTIPISYKKYYDKPLKNLKSFETKKHEFSNHMAICIGDLGFYLANQAIVEGYKEKNNLADILAYYNQIAIKTCQGEICDIVLPFKEFHFKPDNNLEEKIMDIYRLKTAWYSVVGPYCLGLILGNEKKENIKMMEKILMNVGIAFQIKDDLLGIYGDKNLLGKSTNSDIEEYKQTILYSYTMNTSYKKELLKYYGKENSNNEIVKNIFTESGAEKYAIDKMNSLFETSLKQIDKTFLKEESKSLLKGFIIYLKNRSK